MSSASFPIRKINFPIIPQEYLKRDRLLHFFQEIKDSDLILVSAPAGYGKTTLLASWAKECNQPAAWVSLDIGDNDETHFWQLLIESLRSAITHQKTLKKYLEFGESTLKIIESEDSKNLNFPIVEKVIACLISEMEKFEFGELWLILDDLHYIENKFIHHGLAYLLKYQPDFLRVAIGTRSDPPIRLDKMRACGQIIEVRLDTLRFTTEEARIYLNESCALDLSEEEVTHLVKRTDGWVSALQLAASALQSYQKPSHFIAELTGEFETISSFLAVEIFTYQPDEIKRFLLHTSILDRLSGPLCNVLTGRNDSQKILQRMRGTNIPLETLDHTQNLYRYQPLFSDMLRQRLRQNDPEKYIELNKRASQWFETQAGKTDEQELLTLAIDHAINSGDFQRVTDLLEQHAFHLVSIGFESMLINWIDDLPIEMTLPSPFLSAYRLYSMLASGSIHKAEKHLTEAEKYIEVNKKDHEVTTIQGKLKALHAHITAHGDDLDQSIELSKTAIKMLPDNEPFWITISMVALAGAFMLKGDFNMAELLFEETLEFSQKQDSPYLVSVTDIKYLGCLYYRGRMARVESIYENTKSQGLSSRLSERLFGGILDSQYSLTLCEFNRLDQALAQAEIGLEKSERFENYYVLPISWLSMIQTQFARADWEGMDDSIVNLERISNKVVMQPWINNRILAWKVRSLISRDRLTKARRLLDTSGVEIEPDLHFIEEELNLAHARLLLAEKRFSEALHLLNRLQRDASNGGRTRKVIEILSIKACGLILQENLNDALSTIGQALKIAEPFDYLRIFLDEGDLLINLLRKAVESRIHPTYAKKIIRSYYEGHETKPSGAKDLIAPLSRREWDVLGLLEQRMTNEEIAAELVVSTSTVRTHLRSIFRKLNVHRRWDAVARARELDLIEENSS